MSESSDSWTIEKRTMRPSRSRMACTHWSLFIPMTHSKGAGNMGMKIQTVGWHRSSDSKIFVNAVKSYWVAQSHWQEAEWNPGKRVRQWRMSEIEKQNVRNKTLSETQIHIPCLNHRMKEWRWADYQKQPSWAWFIQRNGGIRAN